MGYKTDDLDGQIDGQMSLDDLINPKDRLVAVSDIFARARKSMSLAEQKTFVYALSQLKFTEPIEKQKALHNNIITLDKKTLANIVGIKSDSDHLSVDLFDEIKNLTAHSYIEIREKDLDLYASGFLVTSILSRRNIIKIRFNEDFLPLFTGLTSDYITLWAGDIYQMSNVRSVQFYERLRSITDTRESVNDVGLGIRAIKEMFNIPEKGSGSYMRKDGHFNRTNFEKSVIMPICEDFRNCKMINLIIQSDGKPYEKIKRGGRVLGYRFYWTFSAHPRVATANEVKEIQDRVDKDGEVLKVAKDIIEGEKKPKRKDSDFRNFEERERDHDFYESFVKVGAYK